MGVRTNVRVRVRTHLGHIGAFGEVCAHDSSPEASSRSLICVVRESESQRLEVEASRKNVGPRHAPFFTTSIDLSNFAAVAELRVMYASHLA